MLQNIKESIFKKRFQKSLTNSLENRFVSNDEIVNVGILTTDEISSNFNLQEEIEKILNVKNVKIFSYRKFNKINEASFYHFSENELNWKGEIENQNLQSFLEQPFQLIIGFFNTNNLFLESAVLSSKASFKVGFSNVNSDLYDLEIAEDIKNVHQFTSELKKYLQILKKLKN